MIGGNTNLVIQTLNFEGEYDENGKKFFKYVPIVSIFGWLDLISGDSRYDFKAKIEDSTHVFVCDYEELENIDIEEAKAKVDDEIYDIKFIDNPMRLNKQLEIYLKKVGGQS